MKPNASILTFLTMDDESDSSAHKINFLFIEEVNDLVSLDIYWYPKKRRKR